MKNIFKILILILVGVSVTSCELLVLHGGKNIIRAEKKEEENVIEIVMVIFTVKIQNNKKNTKE